MGAQPYDRVEHRHPLAVGHLVGLEPRGFAGPAALEREGNGGRHAAAPAGAPRTLPPPRSAGRSAGRASRAAPGRTRGRGGAISLLGGGGRNMAAVTGFTARRPCDEPGAVTPENVLMPHKERTFGADSGFCAFRAAPT